MMLANLRYELADGVMVAALTGDIDMSNAGDIGNALARAVTNDTLALVLDLSGVDYFDSAGIHLLYDLRERLAMRGQQLRIVVPPESKARDALELAAVLHAMDVDETPAAAQASIAAALAGDEQREGG